MKQARRVISYATVSAVLYCIVSLLMYGIDGTSFTSSEVISHLGMAIALFLVASALVALDVRLSIYLMLFVMLIYTIALISAFFVVNAGQAGMLPRMLVDVLSVVGLVMNVMCVLAALKQRNNYIPPKIKEKLRKK